MNQTSTSTRSTRPVTHSIRGVVFSIVRKNVAGTHRFRLTISAPEGQIFKLTGGHAEGGHYASAKDARDRASDLILSGFLSCDDDLCPLCQPHLVACIHCGATRDCECDE